MNIAASQFKQPIEVSSKVAFTRFHYGIQTEFQGEVREIRGLSCLISYWSEGEVKEIQIPTDRVRVQDSLIQSWWDSILKIDQTDPIDRVLGDSEDLKEDALGNMDPKGIKVGDLVNPADFYERSTVDAGLSLLRRKSGMVKVLEVSPIMLTLESKAILGYDITVMRRDCKHFERPVQEITPLNIDPIDRVLGDSLDVVEDRKTDALGRGLKGKGHGSIDWKPIRRKRKNGHVWEKYQPWYQWEDETGKHCRYLKKGTDLAVQKLIDQGATVDQILETIGKKRDESRGKTR